MSFPSLYDLNLYEGDDTVWVFQHTDNKGVPQSLAGCQVRLAAKRQLKDPIALLFVHAQLFNEPLGKFAISIPHSVTNGITQGQPLPLVHDIQLAMSNGYVRTLLRGALNITPEVLP